MRLVRRVLGIEAVRSELHTLQRDLQALAQHQQLIASNLCGIEALRAELGAVQQRFNALTKQKHPIVSDVSGVEALAADLGAVRRELDALVQRCESIASASDLRARDIMIVLERAGFLAGADAFRLVTECPVVQESDDHTHPRGTRNDNTRCPRFVRKCEAVFGRKIRALDIGCAGGGLVLDFLLAGHSAVGLEGSDYSLIRQRAEWRLLPNRLFTCDITEPFTLRESGTGDVARFDLITAWEVLEHLPEARLDPFFVNVRNHLGESGLFAASVATFEDFDRDTGAVYHVTVKPREWWHERLRNAGFELVNGLFEPHDFPRGSGNGPGDWDAVANPELGFHVVARLRPISGPSR